MTPNDDQNRMARIAAFAADDAAPAAAAWSMGASPDAAIFAKAADLGLFGLEVPADLGGSGCGFAFKADVCAALAGADFGFAMSVINTHNVAARLAQSAPPHLRDRYLPALLAGRISACTALTEPGAGSDFAAVATRARRTAEGWVLDGEKTWIINARHAGLAIVFAQCVEGGGGDGIGSFLVDLTAPGVRCHPIDGAFSQTAIGAGGFALKGVALPADHMLAAPGSAFKSILAEINGARAYVAAMCCGMLHAALNEAAAYGAQRRTFGKPLAAHQAWRLKLARAQTDLAAARALTAQAAQAIDAGAAARRRGRGAAARPLLRPPHRGGADGGADRRIDRHAAGTRRAPDTRAVRRNNDIKGVGHARFSD